MYLTKTKYGHWIPSDEESYTASRSVKTGTEVEATIARNPEHHRKIMALITLGFNNQDKFKNFDMYRYELMIRSGFFIEECGKIHAESISFKNMGQERFNKVYTLVLDRLAHDMESKPETIQNEIEKFY